MLHTIFHFFQISSGLDIELFRLTFVTSLIISLIVTQRRHNVPIGIIAPGTLVLLIGYPVKLLMVVGISLLVYGTAWIIQKYVLPHRIFAAREKLLLFVLLSILYSLCCSVLLAESMEVLTAGAIGIVLPAMVAENLTKSNRLARLQSFIIATVASAAFFILAKLSAIHFLSTEYISKLNLLYPPTHIMGTESVIVMYFLFAVATVFNIVLYRKKKFKSSGLLLGAYLGILLFQPIQIAFIVFVILNSYLVMNYVFPHIMLYGYRIFVVATLIVSTIYSLTELISFSVTNGTFHPFLGMHIAGIVVCSLLVSEIVQYGYKKVAVGSVSMSLLIACVLILFQAGSRVTHGNFTIASLLNKTESVSEHTIVTKKGNEEGTHKAKLFKQVTIAALSNAYSCSDTSNRLLKPNNIPAPTPLSTTCIVH